MKDIIKKISDLSLYLSVMLLAVAIVGYVFGIAVICGSLTALFRMAIMTVGKIIMYVVLEIVKTVKDIKIMTMMSGEF